METSTMNQLDSTTIKYLRQHEFHADTPVYGVPAGTLAIRDKVMRETGFNHATGTLKGDTGAWGELFEALASKFEEKNGRRPGTLDALFYIVQEGERVSCGCISGSVKQLYFSS